MTIKPVFKKIQFTTEEIKAGVLDTSSKPTIKEQGTVVAIGPDVERTKVGDRIAYKSWAVDISDADGVNLYFIDEDVRGFLGVIDKD